jgi:hypothetical protein
MPIIIWPTFSRAHDAVTAELAQRGFWDERLETVTTWLVPVGFSAYGWQWYGGSGDICIPRVSLARLGDNVLKRGRIALRDLLRHEWGHALADTHRGLFRSRRFSSVFGGSQNGQSALAWNPKEHVSHYAATHPSEVFAEAFMLWLKHGGCLPRRLDTPGIRQRWQFIDELSEAVWAGVRRW